MDAPRRLGLVISFAAANRNVASSPFGGPWPARIAITMHVAGHAFYQDANGVWLTDHVPPGDLSAWPG